jgi:hypothetical protein
MKLKIMVMIHFFIKQANESKVFLEKHGFPEELLKKK